MKKIILPLICFLILFILTLFLNQNSPTKEIEKKPNTNKIQNTTQIFLGYDISSFIAIIEDQKEIKQLEDLFNTAEFTKSDLNIQMPYLRISFSGEKGSTSFLIDNKDTIQIRDGNFIKSKDISFSNLYSIFKEYATNKK